MNIYLIGMLGSGKIMLGKRLVVEFNKIFIDFD